MKFFFGDKLFATILIVFAQFLNDTLFLFILVETLTVINH